jgi:hypothetical protein
MSSRERTSQKMRESWQVFCGPSVERQTRDIDQFDRTARSEMALTRTFSGADGICTRDPLVAKDMVKTL